MHSTSGQVLASACALTALIALAGMTLDSGWRGLLQFGALPILFAALVWAIYARPYVHVSENGVQLSNVFRTVQVAWSAIEDIELQWGLRVVTKTGNYSAWSVPPPRRSRRYAASVQLQPQSRETLAVVNQWQREEPTERPERPLLESEKPVKQWNRTTLIVLGVLILAGAAGIFQYLG